MHPAIFLDRDNTLIENEGDLGDPGQVRLIQGAASAIASLRGLGFRIVVVSNQGGVARGRMTVSDVEAVNQRLADLIAYYANGAKIDQFYFCPYHPNGNLKQYRQEHEQRKPAPGMLLRGAKELDLDLGRSWTIGDQMRDIEAGHRAGTRTVLLDSRPPGSRAPTDGDDSSDQGQQQTQVKPDYIAHSLIEAVRIIAQQRHTEGVAASGQSPAHAQVSGNRWDREAVARLQQTPDSRPAVERQYRPPNSAQRASPSDQMGSDQSSANHVGDDRDNADQRSADHASDIPSSPFEPPPESSRRAFRPVGAPPPRSEEQRESLVRRTLRQALERATAPSPTQDDRVSESSRVQHDQAPQEAPQEDSQTQHLSPGPEVSTGESGGDHSKIPRLILQELRAQRTLHSEFTALSMLAVVLQILAVICLGGGLLMAGAQETNLLLRWLGAGILIQLAVISTLMFARLR